MEKIEKMEMIEKINRKLDEEDINDWDFDEDEAPNEVWEFADDDADFVIPTTRRFGGPIAVKKIEGEYWINMIGTGLIFCLGSLEEE